MVRFATYGFAVALLSAAGTAEAETVSATVQSIDRTEEVIVIDDGRELAVRPGLDTSRIEPGSKVTLHVELIGAIAIVTDIRVN